MLTKSRQERIARLQAQERADYITGTRETFARQVPGEYRGYSADLFGDDRWGGSLSRADALTLRRYTESPSRFAILTGPTGTGKSSAAYTLADALIGQLERSAKFVSSTSMLSAFSFGLGDKSAADVLQGYSEVPILVIDDLGSVNDGMTDHQRRSLWSLIDARWANELHTIITTNMAIHGNRDGLGLSDLVGESAWDRITDSCVVVEFGGESFRGRA